MRLSVESKTQAWKASARLAVLCAAVWLTAPMARAQTNPATAVTPAQQYINFALKACDNTERQLPEISRVAEIVAQRHIAGGVIGILWDEASQSTGQGMEEELVGRSGQMMNIGFNRALKQNRTDAERTNDVLIAGWFKEPGAKDLARLQEFKRHGCYLIGLGPRKLPALAEHAKLCDAWFDTGNATNDLVVKIAADGSQAGHGNLLGNTLNAWTFMGEVIAALTRHGKMPPIAKSFSYEDGRAWWTKYFQKQQFHTDYQVAPIPAGQLGRSYIADIRELLQKFSRTQLAEVNRTADLIVEELGHGRKTLVATMGHMPWAYVGKNEDTVWVIPSIESLYSHLLPGQGDYYCQATPDGALVLRLGYNGHHRDEDAIFKKKHQRVMLITAENPRPEWQLPKDLLTVIDMGNAFGDACVAIPGYPIRALPPSGIMQLVAYEAVNVEVLARIKH